jgi:hypothetical protein
MKLWREERNDFAPPIMINSNRSSPVIPLGTERSAELAERICLAILESHGTDRFSSRDLFGAVPLAIARYVSITAPSTDCSHQFAAAEAIFRHLGRSLLSLSYDRARIDEMFRSAGGVCRLD